MKSPSAIIATAAVLFCAAAAPILPASAETARTRYGTADYVKHVPDSRTQVAAVEEPEQYLSFREEDGRWKFMLKLSAPCEDVACSVYGSDGRRPVPYPVEDGGGASVELKSDATRRVWTTDIPVPPIKSARNGKPMVPWAKATVLGGCGVPLMTQLARSAAAGED